MDDCCVPLPLVYVCLPIARYTIICDCRAEEDTHRHTSPNARTHTHTHTAAHTPGEWLLSFNDLPTSHEYKHVLKKKT
jgi:hypothetical protein